MVYTEVLVYSTFILGCVISLYSKYWAFMSSMAKKNTLESFNVNSGYLYVSGCSIHIIYCMMDDLPEFLFYTYCCSALSLLLIGIKLHQNFADRNQDCTIMLDSIQVDRNVDTESERNKFINGINIQSISCQVTDKSNEYIFDNKDSNGHSDMSKYSKLFEPSDIVLRESLDDSDNIIIDNRYSANDLPRESDLIYKHSYTEKTSRSIDIFETKYMGRNSSEMMDFLRDRIKTFAGDLSSSNSSPVTSEKNNNVRYTDFTKKIVNDAAYRTYSLERNSYSDDESKRSEDQFDLISNSSSRISFNSDI